MHISTVAKRRTLRTDRGVVCANDDLTGDPRAPYRVACHWPSAAHVHDRGADSGSSRPVPKTSDIKRPSPKTELSIRSAEERAVERVEPYIQSLPSLDVRVYQSRAHEETRK